MNRAVDVLAKKLASGAHARAASEGRRAGDGAQAAGSVPMCSTATTVANLPRGVEMEELTLDAGGGAAGREAASC